MTKKRQLNVMGTAADLKEFIERTCSLPQYNTPCSKEHLNMMANQVFWGQVTGEKAQRWIGYITGVLVAHGVTLEQMKQLVKENMEVID